MVYKSTIAYQLTRLVLLQQKSQRYLLACMCMLLATAMHTKGQSSGTLSTPIITVNARVPASGASVGVCFYQNSFAFGIGNLDVNATYSWDFGDGTTSTSINPIHSYSTAGNFKVRLVATNGAANAATDQFVNVYPTPSPSFNVYGGVGNGNAYSFQSSSTVASGYITSYAWDFGDGTSDATSNPTKIYATAGTYPVKLKITSDNGCNDSIIQNVTITQTGTVVVTPPTSPVTPDVPSFTASNPQCVQGNNYSFTNTSVINGTGATYSWDFGDNSTLVSTANATHAYASAGTYNVRLTVTSTAGTTVSNQTVVVYAQPVANFNITNNGATYTFYNTSTIAAGNIATTVWTSSDGNNGAGNQYTQTFTPGNYTVTLRVTSDNGCIDQVTKNLTYATPITASFSVSGTALNSCYAASNSFTFTNTSSTGTGIDYVWDFGDGTTATTYNASHQYTKAGTYIVRLTVNYAGQSAYATPVTIALNPVPAPEFLLYLNTTLTSLSSEVKRCFTPGMDFSFMSSSTVQSGQMHYKWSFATKAIHFRDGDSLDYINPRIVFDTAGIYPVKLVVSTDKGCTDSITHVIKLGHPHAHHQTLVDYGGDKYANPTVTFTNDSYDHQLAITNWQWNFGNSTSSALQNPASFQYACGGNYNVTLRITDEIPCISDTASVVVIRIRPRALYSVSAPNYTPDVYARPTFSFTDNTTINDGCPNLRHNWNFGDGYTSTTKNPTHIFKGSGAYNVRLIVTNLNGGLKDTITQSVTVAIKPKALFSTSQSFVPNVYSSPTITYNNATSSTDTAAPTSSLQYAWDFGDGNTSNAINPTHIYAAGGSYTVTLTVTNPISGLVDVVTHTVTVVIKPKADFSVGSAVFSPDVYAQPSYTFTNTSSVNDASGSLTYAWSFGDGATSTSTSPSHTYTASGVYTVTLVVTNTNGGATDTKTATVAVVIKPKADFNVGSAVFSPDVYAQPSYTFTNTSSVNDASGSLTYAWSFGDGATSTSTSPSHTYTASGVYTVTLVATNTNGGATDTKTATVTVVIKPKADFNVGSAVFSPDVYAQPSYTFTNTSSVNDASGSLTYTWSFGDGATSTSTSPSHTYTASGVYTVTLVVTNTNGGATDTKTATVTVVIKPKADFSVGTAVFSPDVYAQPSYTFTNTSNVNDASGSLTYAWNFGDGATSTSISPSHTYTASGTYTVTLVVTNTNGGATDTKTTIVIVAIKPKASFTTSVTNNTGGYPVVSVTNNSSVNETATLTYTWAFGDGGTSASASPSAYTYNTSAASRTIRLIATNPNSGLKDTSDVVLNNMYILPSNVTYNVPTTDLTLNYTATAIDNSGGTLSYSWSFSDGGTANTASGAYTFANAGTYTAILTITSSNGGSVLISPITFTVTNPVPVARILASLVSSTTGSTDWSLQDGSTISSGTIVNSKLEYYYTSGGGVGSTTTIDPFTGVYTFTIPDFYTLTATLTVTSDRGEQNAVTAFIDPTNNVYSGFKKGVPNNSGTPNTTKIITPFVGSATLFPNPATNIMTVKYKTLFAGAVVIRVFDMSGKQLLQQSVATVGANQTNTTSINVSNLVKGTYNVVISMNGAKLFGSQFIKAQ